MPSRSRPTVTWSPSGSPRAVRCCPSLLRSIDAQGIELNGVEVHRPTLDDVFLTMTGRSLRDERDTGRDATPVAADRRSRRRAAMTVLRETWIVFNRAMRLSLRNPMWSILMLSQPLLYLFLFGPLLKPITAQISEGATTNAYQVFIPGLIVQLGMFGAMFVGFGLIAEYRAGVIEADRVTPGVPDRPDGRPGTAGRRRPGGPVDPAAGGLDPDGPARTAGTAYCCPW